MKREFEAERDIYATQLKGKSDELQKLRAEELQKLENNWKTKYENEMMELEQKITKKEELVKANARLAVYIIKQCIITNDINLYENN